MYGKKYMGIIRSAFLVDEKGTGRHAWPKISPKDTPTNLLKALAELGRAPISRRAGSRRCTLTAALPPFQALLDEHGPDLQRFLGASLGEHDGADCYQETVLERAAGLPRRCATADNLKSWLFTIAHHKAIDHHRRVTRRRAADGRSARGRPWPPTGAGRRGAVGGGRAALPTKQRLAVVQRYVLDLAYAEIAEILDCSEAAARQNVRAGLQRLRDQPRQGGAAHDLRSRLVAPAGR